MTLISEAGTGTRVYLSIYSWVHRQRGCYQVCRNVWFLPCPWEGSYFITGQTSGWVELAPDHRRVQLKWSHRAASGSIVKTKVCRSASRDTGIHLPVGLWVGKVNLRPWLRGARARSWATSGSTAKTGQLACYPRHRGVWIFPVLLADSSGRWPWQNQGQIGLLPSPQGDGAVSESIIRTRVGKLTTWVCVAPSSKWPSLVSGSTGVSQHTIPRPQSSHKGTFAH